MGSTAQSASGRRPKLWAITALAASRVSCAACSTSSSVSKRSAGSVRRRSNRVGRSSVPNTRCPSARNSAWLAAMARRPAAWVSSAVCGRVVKRRTRAA